MTAKIELDLDNTRYRPGEVVSGAVEWSFPSAPLDTAICLRWRAEGKGSPDTGLASTERFGDLRAADRRKFRLTFPVMPYSFSGKVLSIVWRIELVVRLDRMRRESVEILRVVTMSPTGAPIDPYRR